MAVVLGEASGNERAIRAASLLEHGFLNYGWKELFSTTSLDTLSAAANPQSLVSVRSQVLSWDCGNRPKKKPKATADGKKKPKKTETQSNSSSKNGANANKEGSKPAPALKGTNGAEMKPKPKPATDKPAAKAAAAGQNRAASATP
jgi:D-alanyl-D-alanine carboxypeptidase